MRLPTLSADELSGRASGERLGVRRASPTPHPQGDSALDGAGRPYWRSLIASEGATAIRLHFHDFNVGDGQVWIHAGKPEHNQVFGPYTGRGRYGDGDFWTEIVFAPDVYIEYRPSDKNARSSPPFAVSEVFHFWVPFGAKALNYSCFLDATCYTGHQFVADDSNATALIYNIPLPNQPGMVGFCTGQLIVDSNGPLIPYFLTAGHCISSEEEARSAAFVFKYRSSACNGAAPAYSDSDLPQIAGATYITSQVHLSGTDIVPDTPDFPLLSLPEFPSGPRTQLGWTNAAPGNQLLVSVGHPDILPQKLVTGTVSSTSDLFDTLSYTQGEFDHGSSGSAIIDENDHIVGVFSYIANAASTTSTACNYGNNSPGFTNFSAIYPYIEGWLHMGNPFQAAVLQTPPPNSILTGSTVSFQWSAASDPSIYELSLGSTLKGSDIALIDNISSLSVTVPNIPTDGRQLFAQLCSAPTPVTDSLVWTCNNYTYTAYYTADPQPNITGVSTILPQANQTITVTGSGFGSQQPYSGDSPDLRIIDVTQNSWSAGYSNGSNPNLVTLNVTSWTDTQIVIQGLQGDYGQNGWVLKAGDLIQVNVWNPQTSLGTAFVSHVQIPCSYSLYPTAAPFQASGGAGTVNVNPRSPSSCAWTASSNAPWITISSGSAGSGSGTVGYSVAANTSAQSRSGTLAIAGQTFTVNQAAPIAILVGSAAGTTSVVLPNTGTSTDTGSGSFLSIPIVDLIPGVDGGAGSVLAHIAYDAFSGTGTRTGTLTIAGQTVTVTQAGTNYIGPAEPGPAITLVSPGLNNPQGVAVDGAGNVYIADNFNNALKEWTASTQKVTTLLYFAPAPAGIIGSFFPSGLAVDGSGNFYIADDGVAAVEQWNASLQQPAELVGVNSPWGVAVDGSEIVYIADSSNNAIKQWSPATQQVATLLSAGLNGPVGLAVDASGTVYIADQGDSALKDWVAPMLRPYTLVSSGLNNPTGVAVDVSGNVYIADTGDNALKEWSAATRQVTTLVSSGLNKPTGVAVDVSGNVYVADSGNNAIKEIPRAFVGPASLTEPASAGTDSLLPVLPSTASLTGVFAPISDSNWLAIGSIANGVVGFSFLANATTSSRVAHIAILGQRIMVTQNAAVAQQQAQTISFDALANQVLGAAPFTVTATASSGLPVSFNSQTTYVCTVAGSTVTLAALGTCIIRATQAGNASYAAAMPVNRSFTVTASAITGVAVSGGGIDIAQNAWIEIYGANLAPASAAGGLTWSGAPSFADGQMPTSLDGVSVTVDGNPAYVYFICPTQINVLTPLDSTTGPVAVVVNNGTTTTDAFAANLQAAAPGFLRFGGGVYIAALHADYSYLGPASMSVPGDTFTPAAPGETIMLFGDGFGLPSTALTAGSMYQSSPLSTLPQITIGGTTATPTYAGLISPGLYQINVIVPATAANGDNQVIATYAGFASPTGAMIPVAR